MTSPHAFLSGLRTDGSERSLLKAGVAGITPDAAEPVADDAGFSVTPGGEDDEEEDELLEEAVAA